MSRRPLREPRTHRWFRSLLRSLPSSARRRRTHRSVGWRTERGQKAKRSGSVPGLRLGSRGRPPFLSALVEKLRAPLRITVALGLLALINLYVLYYRRGTSLPELIQQATDGRRASLSPRLAGPPGTPPVPRSPSRRGRGTPSLLDYPRVVDVALKPGDTWRGVLAGLQLPPRLQGELETALISLQDPGGLGAGQTLTLFYESTGAGAAPAAAPSTSPSPAASPASPASDDRLVAADYRLTPSMAYHLERVPIGSSERFVSSRLGEPLIVRPARVEVTLGRAPERSNDRSPEGASGRANDRSSERPTAGGALAAALLRAGETPALAARLSEVLACELDVLAEAQPGDRVRLIVEKHLLGGRFYRYGRLLALELVSRSGSRRLRAFLPPSSGPSNAGASPGAASLYYTETGESLARALCRTPLLWTRAPAAPSALPPGPGAPRPAPTPPAPAPTRPSLHAERSRLGLDYAAAPGTPVVALAPGKVSLRGPRGPQGLTVVVTHTGHAAGLETSYQHLGRLARGLTEGAVVRPRQLLGYVGQTGDARKPHLHVSLRVAGRLVDPTPYLSPPPSAPPLPAVRQRVAREAPLPESRRAAFAEAVSELSELLAHADDEAPALVLQQRPAESP